MSESDHSTPDAKGPQPDRGRRALLKGAAWSAPAVLTLTSGNAWAASLTCFERAGGPEMTKEELDKFKEQSLDCYLSGGPLQ